MEERWKLRILMLIVGIILIFHYMSFFCWSLNTEGLALMTFKERVEQDPFGVLSNWREDDEDDDDDDRDDPCSWFGVGCSDLGNVVTLHLKDLCLKGTLTPELGQLAYLKSIILRNNSFSGNIPKEIGELKELEMLDLGYNNFSGLFPSHFAINLSRTTLLLDNNKFLGDLSSIEPVENQHGLSCNGRDVTWNTAQPAYTAHRMLLRTSDVSNSPKKSNKQKEHHNSPVQSPSPSLLPPSPSPLSVSPSISEPPSSSPTETSTISLIHVPPTPAEVPTTADRPIDAFAPRQHQGAPVTPPPNNMADDGSSLKHHIVLIAGIVGGSMFLFISMIGIIFFRSTKVVTVRPWTTGLSGQLRKAFVTGVPKLQRSELEAACEDFSNVIGYFSDGTVYKGTLSSGVEIAVTSTAVVSSKDWSKNFEAQFRTKIDTLSKMNHKNFVNLIGYCEDNVPFTRMMVFEYAPNGTLFEHLHVKEAEHLDWGMRLRIAMGVAYCLEHMHQMTPPLAHKNLNSSSINLTEDYAAKVSDFCFHNYVIPEKMGHTSLELSNTPVYPESNVYSFGVILFEMITGRIPFALQNGSVEDWAADYLSGWELAEAMLDSTLQSFQEDKLSKLLDLIKICTHPDPKERPTMRQIAADLKEITAMGPDGATPKVSPLWWAELEMISTEGI